MSDLDQFDINNTLQCACSPFVYLFFFYYYLFNFRSTRKRNLLYTTGATSGAWIAYPSGAPELDSCYSIFLQIKHTVTIETKFALDKSRDNCVICIDIEDIY
jgi:hypothetical protein